MKYMYIYIWLYMNVVIYIYIYYIYDSEFVFIYLYIYTHIMHIHTMCTSSTVCHIYIYALPIHMLIVLILGKPRVWIHLIVTSVWFGCIQLVNNKTIFESINQTCSWMQPWLLCTSHTLLFVQCRYNAHFFRRRTTLFFFRKTVRFLYPCRVGSYVCGSPVPLKIWWQNMVEGCHWKPNPGAQSKWRHPHPSVANDHRLPSGKLLHSYGKIHHF